MERLRSIAVFCGSSQGRRTEYAQSAEILGQLMAGRGIALVYGGGGLGIMGMLARSIHAAGGHVTGILPKAMDVPSVRKDSVEDEVMIAEGMHERKKAMYDRADAFIALPGGIGTLDEICEIYTWRQLGYHSKNIALLNTCGYWDPFAGMIARGTEEGFISEEVRDILIIEEDPERLLDRLESERAVLPEKLG